MGYTLKRVKPKDTYVHYMTMDIETGIGKHGSALLGDTVYITWAMEGEGFGVPSTDLTEWLLDYFLLPELNEWYLYAHNGFGFDYKRLDWSRIAEAGFRAEFITGTDGSIKSITLQQGKYKWFVRDTLLLLPMTLAKVTKTFAPEHMKLKRQDSFDFREFNPSNADDVEYAIQDAVGLWYALQTFDSLLLDKFGVSVHDGATLPSLAYRAFRLMMDDGEEYPGIGFGVTHASRESYHGGQTIAFQTKEFRDVISLDANSMYPYVMLNWDLPTGKVKRVRYCPSDCDPDHTLCLAIVHIPEGVFPLLKTKDANGRTGNYSGTVMGWYWLFELELQKKLGAEVKILESYVWETETNVAGRFSQVCHDLRMSDYHGPVGAVAKLLNNSLYGKFAQQVADFVITMQLNPPLDGVPYYDPESMEALDCLWQVPGKPSFSADMTHWASFITSKARCILTEAISLVGFDNIIYCDTDSIFFEREHLEKVQSIMGSEYGQFKVEKECETFRAVAPKAYKYVESGKVNVKNKGVPTRSILDQQGFEQLGNDGVKIHFIQSNKLMSMLKTGNGYGRKAHRTLATERSTTNGMIRNHRWFPVSCKLRKLSELRIDEPSRRMYNRAEKIIHDFDIREGSEWETKVHRI